MKKPGNAGLILTKALRRVQEQNPRFSVRTLAKKVGVSHVFMGKVLKGQVDLPYKRLPDIMKALNLDDLAAAQLKEVIQEKYGIEPVFTRSKQEKNEDAEESPTLADFEEKSSRAFEALSHWYEIPLLDLLTCNANTPKTSASLAHALGISVDQATSAIKRLVDIGLITINADGTLTKTQKLLRFPMKMPLEITRSYYKKVLAKAQQELENQSQENYDKRLMTNLSIALDPEKIPVAKQRLQKFLHELSLELADGDSQRVYFLTTLFFPVSKNTE